MGTLLLIAVGAAPISFIIGVAGCVVASGKWGWIFVSGLRTLASWLIGAIGVFFAIMNAAIRDGMLAKYLPLALCIAAPTIPSVLFYCMANALPWQNLR